MVATKTKRIFSLTLILTFLVLTGRLFWLQILNGEANRFLAENNRVRRVIVRAERGLILDRRGEILVRNEPEYFFEEEAKIVSREEALKLQAEGKEVRVFAKRKYVSGSDFSHLLGYLGEVSSEELAKEKLEFKGYSGGSLIGRGGVEMQYERELKGRDGMEVVEVDTVGRIIRRMNKVLPLQGKVLTMSVDESLQEVAAKEMKGRKGAVVASIPRTGEILVFYSSPSYDDNVFLDQERQDELLGLIKDEENQPLLNRVIAGLYPPGSTFKIVTSVAGLEERKITPETLINDPGEIVVNDYKYANWYWTKYGRTEVEVNLTKAIARSVDTYFYKLGEFVGAEKLIFWTKKFGLDEKFGIDLPSELPGFVATPEWKEEKRGEKWFLGNTYHLAIGQGDISLTPLGVNLMTAVVANGGELCTPRILRLGVENTPYQAECRDLGIKKESLEAVRKGLLAACSPGGTASVFFSFKPQVACKTGTAETGDGKTSHAWFTVFAPLDEPEIVLTVLVEKGGEGSSVAAPIAKEILKEYFRE